MHKACFPDIEEKSHFFDITFDKSILSVISLQPYLEIASDF